MLNLESKNFRKISGELRYGTAPEKNVIKTYDLKNVKKLDRYHQ